MIVFTTNNFQIGGRETFVLALAPLLKRQNIELGLIANQANRYDLQNTFKNIDLIPRGSADEVKIWLESGVRLSESNVIELVWAQHFRLLPAWLMSRSVGAPFLATFHGPTIVMPGSRNAIESLGATLALCRGDMTTAVSEEVCASVLQLKNHTKRIELLPNQIHVPSRFPPLPLTTSTTILLLSRSEKLEHIRQAVLLFNHLRQQLGNARLIIYSGVSDDAGNGGQSLPSRLRTTLRRLGRKWLLQNLELLGDLPYIEFRPYTDEPSKAIQKAHIVLGMGRVVLEGLSMGRPTVLVGYNNVIGLVTEQNWEEYSKTNFSGRGSPMTPLAKVAADTLRALSGAPALPTRLHGLIDIEANWPRTYAILKDAMRYTARPRDMELAKTISKIFLSSTDNDSAVKHSLSILTKNEREIFRRLMRY